MKNIYLVLVLSIFLSGGVAFSQEDSSWVNGKIISNIEFEGIESISRNELNGYVNIYIGREFSDELFLELQTLMYDLDYFEFIVPTAKPGKDNPDTVTLVFQVQESPSISKIELEGNTLRKTEIFTALTLKTKDIYSESKMDKAKKEILGLYNGKGFPDVSIEVSKVTNPDKNSVTVTFNINEGKQIIVREVNFKGNNLFATDSKLRSLIDTKNKSLFKPGVYNESLIQSDIRKIEALYHNNGYAKATVVDVKTKLEEDIKKPSVMNMIVDFYIEEGDQYTYGGISYRGNLIYSATDFDKYDLMKYGKLYNKSQHDNTFVRIQSLYYDNGYIENGFQDLVNIDEENKIISNEIVIAERGVAHVGEISITGNEKTKDIVISREIQIESGDVFSRQKVLESMSNIMSTRLFSNTIPQLNKGENGNMDLVFEVEETSTLSLMGGITVSGSDFQPALSFSLKDLNFMGMGRTFGGTLNLGLETQSFSLEFNEPRIFNTEFFGGGSISLSHTLKNILTLAGTDSEGIEYPVLSGVSSYADYEEWVSAGNTVGDNEADLNKWAISYSMSGGHLWYTNYGRARASTGYSTSMDTYLFDVEPFDTAYRERDSGEWLYSDSIWLKGILDNRDTPIGTTQGYGLSQSLSIGGVLPFEHTSDYIKSISNADIFFKIVDTPVNVEWDFILSLRLHAAYTRVFNKPGMDLADSDKSARIDGMFVGRGWAPESDGTALLDLKVELNLPIVPNMFGASLFLDAANLWTDGEDLSNVAMDDFKFSLGASFGITNQVMPISFYMAKTFITENGSIVWSPEENYNKIFGGFATWGISFNLNYLLQ